MNLRFPKSLTFHYWNSITILIILLNAHWHCEAATLQWDAVSGTAGVQLGAGTWSASGGNWRDVGSSTDNVSWNNAAGHTAQFGLSGSATGTVTAVTVSGTVNAAGLEFLGFNVVPGAVYYTLTGGTIQVADGGSISLAERASGISSFVRVSSQLSGENLMVGKSGGTGGGFLELSGNNTGLTGILTLSGANGGVFLRATALGAVNSVSSIYVENLSTFAASASGTYTSDFVLAGEGMVVGGVSSGAIRVDGTGTNQTFTGDFSLANVSGAAFNTNGNNATIQGNITEVEAGSGFTKKGDGVLTLAGTNTYSGPTVVQGGVLALDFNAAGAPAADIITDSAGLFLQGGSLTVTGKAGGASSETFIQTFAEATASVSTVIATGSDLTLDLGYIDRSGPGAVLYMESQNGAVIKATGSSGLVGAWSKYQNGGRTGWAEVTAGVVGLFEGELEYATGTAVTALPGYNASSNLAITHASEGDVDPGAAGMTALNSLTMADHCHDRTLTLGAAQTLRMANTSGIQILSDARSLTIGETSNVGQLTAGNFNATELILSNWSSTSTLLVNAKIVDHGGGGGAPSTDLTTHGAGNTVLTAANTYTGVTRVMSGTLEVRNNSALGTTAGSTVVAGGAALLVRGGLSGVAENIDLNGSGLAGAGALLNAEGSNTLSGTINLQSATTIGSTAGTLILSKGAGTEATNIITGSGMNLTFTGAGTIEVRSRIATAAGTIVKNGDGMVVLGGNNTFTGSVTVNTGTLRMTHGNALGTTAGSTTVASGATLDLAGGITTTAEGLTVNGLGAGNKGALRSSSGVNNYAGSVTVAGVAPAQISADAGSTLNLTAATALQNVNNNSRTAILSGEGVININGNAKNQGTGVLSIVKEGTGTVNLNGTANTNSGTTTVSGGILNIKGATQAAGATTVSGGTLNLDFTSMANGTSNIILAASSLTVNGGTLQITGKAGTSNSQTFAGLAVGSSTTNVGRSTVSVSGGTASLIVGAITRSQDGHTIDFRAAAGTNISATATTGAGGILLDTRGNNAAYATFNGDDWAAISAGKIVGGESVVGFYTGSTSNALSGNADIALGVTTTTLGADTGVTSLRFDKAQATTIDMTGTVALTTGGILVTSDVGNHDVTIATTTLGMNTAAGSGDLVIIQNNMGGNLIVNSVIANSTGGTTSLTKAGAGTLVLTRVNTYSGATRITEGTVELQGDNRLATGGSLLLGGGNRSAKLRLAGSQTFGGSVSVAISGTGTDNRVVGGAETLSTLLLTGGNATAMDFRNGFLGGAQTLENNLSLVVNLAASNFVLQLGGANTYAGKTTLTRGIVDVSVLADAGIQSSLGAGGFDATTSVITLGGGSVGTTSATLRYVGTTDSTTNRVVDLAGGGATATLQNNGTGTLKFTSAFTALGGISTTVRQLTLTGTNAGLNEIVALADGPGAATTLTKTGSGTWAITGASSHSGTTTVSTGTLLANNAAGSATGTGNVLVQTTGRLGGNGTVGSATAQQNITVASTGILSVGSLNDTAGQGLHLTTSGIGVISLNGTLELNIFGNDGGLNALANNDVLVLKSDTSIQLSGTLSLTDSSGTSTCWEAGDSWQLIDWQQVTAGVPVSGSFNSMVLPTLAEGLKWNLDSLYSSGVLSIDVVPEPGRLTLAGLAFAGLALRRSRSSHGGKRKPGR